MNVLFIILTVVIVLAAILLIIVVLLQNGKGAGMASNFVAGNQTLGVPPDRRHPRRRSPGASWPSSSFSQWRRHSPPEAPLEPA